MSVPTKLSTFRGEMEGGLTLKPTFSLLFLENRQSL